MSRTRDEVIYLRLTKEEKEEIIKKMQSIRMTNLNDNDKSK